MEASVFRNVILYQTYYYYIIIVTYEQKDTFFLILMILFVNVFVNEAGVRSLGVVNPFLT